MLGDVVDRILREELVGERADHREWLWHRLWELDRTEEFPIWVFGIVDVALWDLEGHVLDVPAHRLLGTYRDEIPAYASLSTFLTTEEYLDVVDQCLELGYSAIKLHAWGDARADAELCRRCGLTLVTESISCTTGRRRSTCPTRSIVGRALSDTGYLWYEEPMLEFNITAYKWLAERVNVPLLVAETSDGSSPQYGGLHRVRLRVLCPHKRESPWRDNRRDAHRPPRRLVPPPGRGSWADRAHGAPLHGHSKLHLLRVTRHLQPGGSRAERRARRSRDARPVPGSPCRNSFRSFASPRVSRCSREGRALRP